MGSFVINKRGDALFCVMLIGNHGKVILRGNDCQNLDACKYSIDGIRANAVDSTRYELMTSGGGKFYFKLRGSDGTEIARSEVFDTIEELESGINWVRQNTPYSLVDYSPIITSYYQSN